MIEYEDITRTIRVKKTLVCDCCGRRIEKDGDEFE